MKFRAKPVEIEAAQWLDTDESWAAVCALVDNAEDVLFRNPGGMLAVEATGVRAIALPGDWLTKTAAGALSVCEGAAFTDRYEAVS